MSQCKVLCLVLICLPVAVAHARLPTKEDMIVVGKRLQAARKALKERAAPLDEEERSLLGDRLDEAEAALSDYRKLARKGDKRGPVTTPLYAAGAAVLADDLSGMGVADDVFLPFVAIGLLVTYLATEGPAGPEALEQAWREVMERLDAVAKTAAAMQSRYIPPPKELKGFPHAVPVPKKTGRARWVDQETGEILEWDSQHGKVEKYNKKGKHLGEFDPETGTPTKPANPGRKTER